MPAEEEKTTQFTMEFTLEGAALKKMSMHYGRHPDHFAPDNKVVVFIKGKINKEEGFLSIDKCGTDGYKENYESKSSKANLNAAQYLNDMIIAELHIHYLHLNAIKNKKCRLFAIFCNISFIDELRKKGVLSIDTATKSDTVTPEELFDFIDTYKNQLELGRDLYIAEGHAKKIQPPPTTEEKNQGQDAAVKKACVVLQREMAKYFYKAAHRSYAQNIFRVLSAQLTLDFISQENISFEDLVKHLRGHIAATRENHARLGRWPFFRSLYNPQLVDVYEKALNVLKKNCPKEFADTCSAPIQKPLFTLEKFNNLFTKLPSDIAEKEARLDKELALAADHNSQKDKKQSPP